MTKGTSRGKYSPEKIEKKWQKIWDKKKFFNVREKKDKKKSYILVEFPYPSGDGLHVGHVRSYSALDAVARKKRLEGKNVLFPMGWDAFGLPTENYAIKTGVHPRKATDKNIATFRKQLKSLGLSFDWSREIDTTDPKYYKWTQWIFLQLYRAGLAYQAEMPINWCPSCKIGLANEEVVAGQCERCGAEITRRRQKQWLLKITAYADRLLKDLNTVDYPPKIRTQQENWIGRSEGTEIQFKINNQESEIRVFTTRPDTIFGATYLVLAPEHPLIGSCKSQVTNYKEVDNYIKKSARKSDLDRTDLTKEKTGVELKGIRAINPASGEEIPIWTADYVLMDYGTGAIMAVPAHDQRDFEFAKKFNLPIRIVIEPETGEVKPNEVFRKRIVALVHDPKSKKVLTLDWGDKYGGHLLIGGGINKGEDVEQAAQREIKEETGYTNVKLLDKSETVHHHYVAYNKGVNRVTDIIGLFFELNSDQKVKPKLSQEEQGKFQTKWLSYADAGRLIKDEMHNYLFRKFIKGDVYTGEGIVVNSKQFDGLNSEQFKKKMTEWLEKQGLGSSAVNYKLRDWIFSRQHYWGEPIPIIHCDKCGVVPVPEKDLPIELPYVEKYKPINTGESPLATVKSWVNTKCPICRKPAKRETDTMPNWAGSSWYFLRYCDPENSQALADKNKLKYWMPVDIYNGGMEHTTLHLLYSRFWHKFLYDKGFVPTAEPYKHRHSHGMILAEDGRKMSKSFGNVINPDGLIKKYGADSVRLYEMFIAPFEETTPWSTQGLIGVRRFLDRIYTVFANNIGWGLLNDYPDDETRRRRERIINKTIKKVTDDFDDFKFNTAVSSLMECFNERADSIGESENRTDETLSQRRWAVKNDIKNFLLLLYPMAPHIAAELWEKSGFGDLINEQVWPKYDSSKLADTEIMLVVQINGKVRDRIKLPADLDEQIIKEKALASDNVRRQLSGRPAKRMIYVKNKIINIVV